MKAKEDPKKRKEIKIFFTGGGTGGHVFPGIAIAQELVSQKIVSASKILWIGSGSGIEKEIVGRFGFRYKGILSGKLRRYFSLRNFLDIFKITIGIFQAFLILLFDRPQLIFSKGGYVSVPPCLAAKLLRIPVISHESDITPGLATRINSRFSSLILTAYDQTNALLPAGVPFKTVGNPVRGEIYSGNPDQGRIICQVPKGKKMVLILGGSLGAAGLNRLIDEAAEIMDERLYFVHQTGEKGYTPLQNSKCMKVPFFGQEFAHVLSAADLVVSRAGAGTLWENAALCKPAILVPLGKASSRGDQIVNAQYFKELGSAIVFNERETTGKQLLSEMIDIIYTSKRYEKMKKSLEENFKNNPAKLVAIEVAKILKHQTKNYKDQKVS